LLKAADVFQKDEPELLVITRDFEGEEGVEGKR